MLIGSDGPGGLDFTDAKLTQQVATVCLIAILWDGGISTRWREMAPVIRPALALATVGVVASALITGLVAWPLLSLDPLEGLLVGAVVASTDAAAVFATLRHVRIRRRLQSLLEAESGLNDPMAIALALGLTAWVLGQSEGVLSVFLILLRELGVGGAVALLVGLGLRLGAGRARHLVAAYAPLASVGLALLSFGLADTLGGSGYLAVYVVGVVFGSLDLPDTETLRIFHQGLAFAAELGLFLMLGLLVFPQELTTVALPGLAIAGILAFVARPASVWLSTLGAGLSTRERAFVSWAGLRGGVPIVLAAIVLAEGVTASQEIFNAVFFVVLVSAVLQGMTLSPLAKRLGLDGPEAGNVPDEVSRTG
jgi:cell volume regulation protein A